MFGIFRPKLESKTALHEAAAKGDNDQVTGLLGDQNINFVDRDGRTALHWATINEHPQVAETLLNHRTIDVNIQDKMGKTTLHYAARHKHKRTVATLLNENKKIDVSVRSKDGRTALHEAVERGHHEVVQALCLTADAVSFPDSRGRTPLHWAAEYGDEEAVNLLLQKHVDLDCKDHDGQTALHRAARNGYETIMQRLVNNQADVLTKNKNGETALHIAAENGHLGAAMILLNNHKLATEHAEKAQLLIRKYPAVSSKGELLWWAAEEGHAAVVELLLETGKVFVDPKDEYDRTPLSLAAGNGNQEVVKLLLKTGEVDVDSKDENRRTPLSWAAASGNQEVVKLLLKTGQVNVDSMDKNHQSPLSWAAASGNQEVVKLLLKTGEVDVDSMDKNLQTPLSWAAKNQHEAVVELLLDDFVNRQLHWLRHVPQARVRESVRKASKRAPVVARKFNISQNLVSQVPQLALYDFIVVCDNSNSMIMEESRIPTLEATVKGLFRIHADVGSERRFSIVPFNGQIAQPRSEVDVHRALESFEYYGRGNASYTLNSEVLPQLEDMATGKRLNPTVVVVITDGDVGDVREFDDRITQLKAILDNSGIRGPAVLFLICRVGSDIEAAHRLARLKGTSEMVLYSGDQLDSMLTQFQYNVEEYTGWFVSELLRAMELQLIRS